MSSNVLKRPVLRKGASQKERERNSACHGHPGLALIGWLLPNYRLFDGVMLPRALSKLEGLHL